MLASVHLESAQVWQAASIGVPGICCFVKERVWVLAVVPIK